jgi:hypothetical protein
MTRHNGDGGILQLLTATIFIVAVVVLIRRVVAGVASDHALLAA